MACNLGIITDKRRQANISRMATGAIISGWMYATAEHTPPPLKKDMVITIGPEYL